MLSLAKMLPTSSTTFFFFNDTATTEIYTLSLHDALPIFQGDEVEDVRGLREESILEEFLRVVERRVLAEPLLEQDRKSTRLNSSHLVISYAVFCLKKKKTPSLVKQRTGSTT